MHQGWGREECPHVGDSPSTTDSMIKLAKESLELGRILGIKVIANEGNAMKRITESLKASRSKKQVNWITKMSY